MKKLFVPALAIITLLLVACSSDGDTLSGGNATSQDPTATAELVSQTPAARLDLDLGSFENIDLARLIEELLNSPELIECLTDSMDLSRLMELAEREPTDADIEQLLPCLSRDQLDALTSLAEADLDLSSFEDAGLAELIEELLGSTELKECLTDSMDLSSLMELAEREPTDADIEQILPCLSEDQLDALKSVTGAGLDLGSFEDAGLAELMEGLLNSPGLADCLSGSTSLSSLMELAEGELADADIELILPCLSEGEVDAPTSATAPDLELAGLEEIDIEGLTRELLSSPELMACLTSSMSLSSLLELAEGEATDADLELIFPCLSEDQLDSLLEGFTG